MNEAGTTKSQWSWSCLWQFKSSEKTKEIRENGRVETETEEEIDDEQLSDKNLD